MTQEEKTDSVINKANMYYGETVLFPLDHNADRRNAAKSRLKRSDLRANTIADHAMELARKIDEILNLTASWPEAQWIIDIVEAKP